MSGRDFDGARGTGFVHLNTPASIEYTAGQTLSLSALRQRKSRVECVVLPESIAVWRRAFQHYTKDEGYSSYAADAEDERMGNGVILPPLVPQRSGPQRRRDHNTVSTRDAFFSAPQLPENGVIGKKPSAPTADSASSSVAASESGTRTPMQISAATSVTGGNVSAFTPSSPAAPPTKGITIVSHHKVTGRQQFVYPDHDGVLSAGVVPQIVMTPEDKAEEEASKMYYLSPLNMTEEELAAFEELQALWKGRARSHSFLGAQHRNAAKGSTDPSVAEQEGEIAVSGGRLRLSPDGRPLKSRRVEGLQSGAENNAYAEAETAVDDASSLDKELAEALRLADELLRFA